MQGHVDTTATCLALTEKDGSREYSFSFDPQFSALVIEKGSIAINGISLTLFDVGATEFSVAIIPYTYENTTMRQVSPGTRVNVEFDVFGKYVQRYLKFAR